MLNWLMEPGHPRDLADVRLCRLVLVLSTAFFGTFMWLLGPGWIFGFLIPALHIGIMQHRIRVRKAVRAEVLPTIYAEWFAVNLPTQKDLKFFIDAYVSQFGWSDSRIKTALCKYLDERFMERVANRRGASR
jgi:hypothetical protein